MVKNLLIWVNCLDRSGNMSIIEGEGFWKNYKDINVHML